MNSSPLILAIGYHDRESPRHRTVCEALTKDGGEIFECHTQAKGFFGKYRELAHAYHSIGVKTPHGASLSVLVPFPGHFLMPLAWWLTRKPRRRLIFDAFLSLHDTEVHDRRRYSAWHPYAWFLWLIDWTSMHLADEVLIDTEAHRQFLIQKFHLHPDRVKVIYLEARKDLFYPISDHSPIRPFDHPAIRPSDHPFNVFFYGTVIPLQGIDVILDAAAILEKNPRVRFTFTGPAKLEHTIAAHQPPLKNMTYRPFASLKELADGIRAADLCLGIFGTSEKARRVIPHKVIDAVACGVPVITADTPAIRERFADHPLVHLIPAGDAEALADKIQTLLAS